MNTKLLFSLLAGAALLEATVIPAARADWEYTRWGMTPEQAQAAADGTLTPVDQTKAKADLNLNPETTLFKTDWSIEDFDFNVFLNFTGSEPKLTEIIFKADGHNRGELGQALIEKYGLPNHSRVGMIRRARAPRFRLVEGSEFAKPDQSPQTTASSTEPMRIIMEWETPTNFIQYSRRGSEEVLIHVQPRQESIPAN